MDEEELKLLRNVVGDKGKLIFAMVGGSYAYNMNTPNSDKDYLGVYIAEENGPLFPAPSSFDKTSSSKDQADYVVYEIGKYCELLQKGNPKVIEPLFAVHGCWESEEWQGLKSCRDDVLNLVTAQQYHGYAHLKIKQIEKEPDYYKAAYHAYRLLWECLRILEGNPPQVYLTGEHRDELMEIRKGQSPQSREQILNELRELERKVLEIIDGDTHEIPKTLDTTKISRWLTNLRLQGFQRSHLSPALSLSDNSPLPDRLRTHIDVGKRLLDKRGIQGTILFAALSGGKAYEISECEDDVVLIFACRTSEAVDMFKTTPTVVAENDGDTETKYRRGIVLYEAESAVRMLLQGNHQLVEALYSPVRWESDAWKQLIESLNGGTKLLCQTLIMHYLGVGEQLAKKLCESPDNINSQVGRKQLVIAHRLVLQAKRVIAGNIPDTNLDETIKSKLVELRRDESKVLDEMHPSNLLNEIKQLRGGRNSWGLPSMPEESRQILNTWLVGVRKAML